MINFKKFIFEIKNSRIINDSFWAILGNVLGKGLALVGGIIIARFLGKETFGEFGIIKNTILSISILSTFGLGYSATKFVAQYKNSKPEYINTIIQYSNKITLVVSGILSLGLFLFTDQLADKIFKAPHLILPLKFTSILVIFSALTTTQIGILAGFGEYRGLARINILVGVFTLISSILLTYFYHLNGALISLLSAQMLNWYLNLRLIKNRLVTKIRDEEFDRKLFKDILRFSYPLALQEALYSLTVWMGSLLLIKFSNYGQLGLYSAAVQLSSIILFIPGILRNVILTHLSENVIKTIKNRKIIFNMLILNFLITFVPALILSFFSNKLSAMYGNSFTNLKDLLAIAFFTTVFSSISTVYTQSLLSLGESFILFTLRFFREIGVLLLFYFIMAKYSPANAAYVLVNINFLFQFLFLLSLVFVNNKYLVKSNC